MHVCANFKLLIPNISGVIDINVAKGDQMSLRRGHYESHDLRLCPGRNYYEGQYAYHK